MGKRALILALAVLAGCATDVTHERFVEQVEITNPQAVCAGAEHCVLRSEYQGLVLCKLVSLPSASHSVLGALLRGCLE